MKGSAVRVCASALTKSLQRARFSALPYRHSEASVRPKMHHCGPNWATEWATVDRAERATSGQDDEHLAFCAALVRPPPWLRGSLRHPPSFTRHRSTGNSIPGDDMGRRMADTRRALRNPGISACRDSPAALSVGRRTRTPADAPGDRMGVPPGVRLQSRRRCEISIHEPTAARPSRSGACLRS